MLDMTRRYATGTVFWDQGRERFVGQYAVHDGTERRKRKSVSAKTEAECWRKLRAARSTSAATPILAERAILATFLRRWLADAVIPEVRPRTADNYRSQLETHIIPAIGGFRLAALTAPDVMRYRNRKLAEGLAPRTVSHHLTTIRTALGQAERWGLVSRNVASQVQGPRIPKTDIRILTWPETLALTRGVKGDPWEGVYVLAIAQGLRQGECLGLRWGDLDLKGRRLEVRKTLTWLKGAPFLDDPKTDKSARSPKLTRRAVAALRKRRLAQVAERLADPDWIDRDLVFTAEHGDPIRRDLVTRALQRHLERLGLPRITFHQLRHGYVTHLHGLGMSMDEIADVVGHASRAETSDTYAHLPSSVMDRAADLMDEAMSS